MIRTIGIKFKDFVNINGLGVTWDKHNGFIFIRTIGIKLKIFQELQTMMSSVLPEINENGLITIKTIGINLKAFQTLLMGLCWKWVKDMLLL